MICVTLSVRRPQPSLEEPVVGTHSWPRGKPTAWQHMRMCTVACLSTGTETKPDNLGCLSSATSAWVGLCFEQLLSAAKYPLLHVGYLGTFADSFLNAAGTSGYYGMPAVRHQAHSFNVNGPRPTTHPLLASQPPVGAVPFPPLTLPHGMQEDPAIVDRNALPCSSHAVDALAHSADDPLVVESVAEGVTPRGTGWTLEAVEGGTPILLAPPAVGP
jgi:hypothetical protein